MFMYWRSDIWVDIFFFWEEYCFDSWVILLSLKTTKNELYQRIYYYHESFYFLGGDAEIMVPLVEAYRAVKCFFFLSVEWRCMLRLLARLLPTYFVSFSRFIQLHFVPNLSDHQQWNALWRVNPNFTCGNITFLLLWYDPSRLTRRKYHQVF